MHKYIFYNYCLCETKQCQHTVNSCLPTTAHRLNISHIKVYSIIKYHYSYNIFKYYTYSAYIQQVMLHVCNLFR